MKKKYYIHALQSYQKLSYIRKGPYRYRFIACFVLFYFIYRNPYGEAVITNSEISPELI